jgi:hypothetical protein
VARSQTDFIIEDLTRFTEKKVSAIGLGVVANLREDTPRDTSWARSNWIGSKGSPAAPLKEPSGRPDAGDVALARAASAAGDAALASYRLEQGSLFATNNVPYIIPLNNGSSKQAGAGFVERAVERAIREGR